MMEWWDYIQLNVTVLECLSQGKLMDYRIRFQITQKEHTSPTIQSGIEWMTENLKTPGEAL